MANTTRTCTSKMDLAPGAASVCRPGCNTCHSLFFTKFPPEIRRLIYEFLLPEKDVPEECYPDWEVWDYFSRLPVVLSPFLVPVKPPILLSMWGEARDYCREHMRFAKWDDSIMLPCRPYRPDIDTLCLHVNDIQGYWSWASNMHATFPQVKTGDGDDEPEGAKQAVRAAGALKATKDQHGGYRYKPWEIQKLRIGVTKLYTTWKPDAPSLTAQVDTSKVISRILWQLRGLNRADNRQIEILDLSANTGIQGGVRTEPDLDTNISMAREKGTLSESVWAVSDVIDIVLNDLEKRAIRDPGHHDPNLIDWYLWARDYFQRAFIDHKIHIELPRHGVCVHPSCDSNGPCFQWNGHHARPKSSSEWRLRQRLFEN